MRERMLVHNKIQYPVRHKLALDFDFFALCCISCHLALSSWTRRGLGALLKQKLKGGSASADGRQQRNNVECKILLTKPLQRYKSTVYYVQQYQIESLKVACTEGFYPRALILATTNNDDDDDCT